VRDHPGTLGAVCLFFFLSFRFKSSHFGLRDLVPKSTISDNISKWVFVVLEFEKETKTILIAYNLPNQSGCFSQKTRRKITEKKKRKNNN